MALPHSPVSWSQIPSSSLSQQDTSSPEQHPLLLLPQHHGDDDDHHSNDSDDSDHSHHSLSSLPPDIHDALLPHPSPPPSPPPSPLPYATSGPAFAREMLFQIIPMVILALAGLVLAGEVLARIKKWPVFSRVPELFILVPILLNLKGNLEMNLACRLSTYANSGQLDNPSVRNSLLLGNLALLQVQALIVSAIAGLASFLLGIFSSPVSTDNVHTSSSLRGSYFEAAMVLAVAMLAASFSSAILGAFMSGLVVLSRKLKMNPDNFATPLAASLGDLLTLVVLGLFSTLLGFYIATFLSSLLVLFLILSTALHIYLSRRNKYTRHLISTGWIPLITALVISSATGLVLQQYVNSFKGYGLLAPVLTGLAGNFGAIFASRISTALHVGYKEHYIRSSVTLLSIAVPCLAAFIFFAWGTDQIEQSWLFFLLWTIVSTVAVLLSLFLAYGLTLLVWKYGMDPDIVALPLLSSFVDLIGQLLLVLAFKFAS